MPRIRILAVTLVLCFGSVMASAAGPDKDKEKEKEDKAKEKTQTVVTVPDGGSSALLFALGEVGLGVTGVFTRRRAYARFSVFTKKNRSAETWSFTVRGSSFRSRSR